MTPQDKLDLYRKLAASNLGEEKKITQLQLLESELLKEKLIGVDEANSRTNRFSAYRAVFDESGKLVDSTNGEDLSWVAEAYSRMKFGSWEDIKLFATKFAEKFIEKFEAETSDLRALFEQAKAKKEFIVRIEAGSRNVEHSGFFVFDEAYRRINTYLAVKGFPTIVRVRPSRLEVVPGNYASMSKEERENLAPTTDQILPGIELFEHPVHVIFSDDVRITGATADRVERKVRSCGAKSYTDMYLIEIHPDQALWNPETEQRLNQIQISGGLDERLQRILVHPKFRPVQRLLRLILGEKNRPDLKKFLSSLPEANLIRLYVAALNNNYQVDKSCVESVEILSEILGEKKLIDQQKLPVGDDYEY